MHFAARLTRNCFRFLLRELYVSKLTHRIAANLSPYCGRIQRCRSPLTLAAHPLTQDKPATTGLPYSLFPRRGNLPLSILSNRTLFADASRAGSRFRWGFQTCARTLSTRPETEPES